MNRVLVTGGAGFIGVPTVERLLAMGREVVVLDNFSNGHRERLDALQSPQLRVVKADIRDADVVKTAFASAQPDAVIHLAALHFIPYCNKHPAETVAVNILGTQLVLDAAEAVDVTRFVLASTADVYRPSERKHREGDPTGSASIYGASKLMCEQLVGMWRMNGATTEPVIARLFNVVGPGETNPHVVPDICARLGVSDIVSVGNRSPRRDYVYVGDVADALVGLLETGKPDLVVNVGTGLSWSVDDLVNAIARLTGRNLRVETDEKKVRPTDRPNLQADVDQLRSALPDATPTGLEQALTAVLIEAGILSAPQK